MAILGAERRPPNQTLKHDGPQRPPIAIERVAMSCEDLGSNVVWGSDRRVGHQSSRSTPVVDLRAIANRQINLVNSHRVPVSRSVGFALQQLLIVVVVVQSVEPGRKSKVGQLNMAAAIQEDVVWFDITEARIRSRPSARGIWANLPVNEA
jgi:hypothetical protein